MFALADREAKIVIAQNSVPSNKDEQKITTEKRDLLFARIDVFSGIQLRTSARGKI